MSVKPISPDQVSEAKRQALPSFVIEAVNHLLAMHYRGAGVCTLYQKDIVAEIVERGNITRQEVSKKGYLNFIEIYRAAGWQVEYDSPGYNETYDTNFRFSRRGCDANSNWNRR